MTRYGGLKRGNVRPEPRDITVKHPLYGETTVKAAREKLDAVMEAARRWKAPWSTIVRECSFEEARG